MHQTFTTTFLSGSGRNARYVANLNQFCHPSEEGASKLTIQGKHWKVLRSLTGFKTSQEAVLAAKSLTA